MNIDDAIKSTRKEITISELYAKVLERKLTENEFWLLTELLKRVALSVHRDILIFSETHYIDLNRTESPESF